MAKNKQIQDNEVELVEAEEITESPKLPSETMELAKISESGLTEKRAIGIILEYKFPELLKQIADYEKELDGIEIKDENDFENMERCGTIRKALVKIRTGSKSTHNNLKEDYKLTGKFIDTLHNTVSDKEENVEKKAKEKEEYGERIAAERKNALIKKRQDELAEYEYNYAGLDLGNMPDNIYAEKVEEAKLLQEAKAKIKADKLKAEQEAFEEQQKLEQEKELQSTRLSELNRLGLIYSNDDLGKIDDNQYQIVKANLINQKHETEKENERIRNEQAAKAKKDADDLKVQQEQIEALRKQNEEAEKKLADERKKVAEQEEKLKEKEKELKKTGGGNIVLARTKRVKNMDECKALIKHVGRINSVNGESLIINDGSLKRVYDLYTGMIKTAGEKMIAALDEYEKR